MRGTLLSVEFSGEDKIRQIFAVEKIAKFYPQLMIRSGNIQSAPRLGAKCLNVGAKGALIERCLKPGLASCGGL